MSEFTFDEGKHEYRLDGAVLPSVSSILVASGLLDTTWFTEEAASRGTRLHKVLASIDAKHPPEESTEGIEDRIDAWHRFKADTNFVPIEIEKPKYHKLYKYAGTKDRSGILGPNPKHRVLLDIKSGAFNPVAHPVQLAAYNLMEEVPAIDLWVVELRADGSYRIHVTNPDSQEATRVFMACLTMRAWRGRKGA